MNDDSKQRRLDAVHEEIIAYLDGELDAEAMKRVEQQLTQNPHYRLRLQQLERVWKCLDLLPEEEVNETFTTSTVELVTVAAEQDVQQVVRTSLSKRRTHWLVGLGVLFASTATGFLLCSLSGNSSNNDLLNDLQVIENVDQYLHAGSVEFLEQLHAENMFSAGNEEAGHADSL